MESRTAAVPLSSSRVPAEQKRGRFPIAGRFKLPNQKQPKKRPCVILFNFLEYTAILLYLDHFTK